MKSVFFLGVLCWASAVSAQYQKSWCLTVGVDNGDYWPRRRYFWKGYSITYTCNKGYQMVGPAKLTCVQGIGWNARAPTCEPTTRGCSRPDSPANGNIKPFNQHHFYVGDKIWFTCNAGYEILDGEKKDVTCLSSGWSHDTPDCIRVSRGCGQPEAPEKGGLKPIKQSYSVDEKVWYFCDAGYTINKDDKKDIVCKSNGQWSHGPPRCEADSKSCGRPARVRYAYYRPYASSYKPGTSVTYRCRNGYKLNGEAEATCQDNGNWDSTPSCSIITCSKPDIPDGGDIRPNKESYRTNERVYFRCNQGYSRSGPSYAKCINGKWSGTAACTAIQCDPLQAPDNGSIEPEQNAYDVTDVITFSCDDGYMLVGSASSTCRENAHWSNAVPTCQSNTCAALTAPFKGELSPIQTVYQVNDVISFSCEGGYELMGAEEVVCQSNGDWTDVEPTCEAVTCDGLIAPENGQQSSDKPKYRIGEQVDFTCDDGFDLVGSEQLECLESGTWSDVEPTCRPRTCGELFAPDNGEMDIVQTEYDVGQTVTFTCFPTFILVGADQLTCQSSGEWDALEPVCEEITCDALIAPDNGAISSDDEKFNVGETVEFTCDEGFNLIGATSSVCQDSTLWSEPEPFCELVSCNALVEPQNGEFSSNQDFYSVGDTIDVTCDQGYILVGASQLACEIDGSWSDEVPICEAVTCAELTPPVDGGLSPTQDEYAVDAIITFTCDEGFELVGSVDVRCQADGTWTDFEPVCIPRQCSELETPLNGEMDLVKVFYDVGDVVTFTCVEGFTLTGAESTTCQSNGNWSDEEPTCIAVMCDPLPPPNNGDVNPFQPTGYGVDDVITFSCDPGYELDGAVTSVCQSDATWTEQPPVCNEVTCAPLFAPANGGLGPEGTSYNVNSEITFTCDEGYILTGSEVVTCGDDGNWSDFEPTCEAIQCFAPIVPENGEIQPQPSKDLYDRDEEVFFSCDEGYRLVGATSIVCLLSGDWSDIEPTCEQIICDRPATPQNGNIDSDLTEFPFNSVVFFTCDEGYTLNGAELVTCQEDSLWSDVEPTCEAVQCQTLDAPLDGSLSPSQDLFNVDATITFTCDPGFTLIGADEVACLVTGTWSDVTPICEPVECGELTAPANGGLSPSFGSYPVDSVVTFTCDDGFFFNGAEELTCLSTGEWSDVEPTCEAEMCDQPEVPEFGSIISIKTMYPVGGVAEFSCNLGYQLVGAETITCEVGAIWSDVEPTCEPITCRDLTAPDQGSLSPVQGTYSAGDLVGFTCDDGYIVQGASHIRCLHTGLWSDVEPTCQEIRCPALTAPDQGSLSPDQADYAIAAEVTFTCDENFNLKGEEVLRCLPDGRWSHPEPTCAGVTCRRPSTPRYGYTKPSKSRYNAGESAEFGCRTGYRLQGASEILCLYTGLWSEPEPTCQVVTCPIPDKPDKGSFSPSRNRYVYRNRLYFRCTTGYVVDGSSRLFCKADGTWDKPYPTCRQVSCPNIVAPDNGFFDIEKDNYYANDVLTFGCDEGFQLSGNERIVCLRNGRWTASAPTCIPATCPNPRPPQHGSVGPQQGTPYQVGDFISYECDEGYAIKGEADHECLPSGQWSHRAPYCVVPKCSSLPAPVNGGVHPQQSGDSSVGTKLWFYCNLGYMMVGTADIECEYPGTWSAGVPTCVRGTCAGRCGVLDSSKGCQCHYQCGRLGNCCHDYHRTCSP